MQSIYEEEILKDYENFAKVNKNGEDETELKRKFVARKIEEVAKRKKLGEDFMEIVEYMKALYYHFSDCIDSQLVSMIVRDAIKAEAGLEMSLDEDPRLYIIIVTY